MTMRVVEIRKHFWGNSLPNNTNSTTVPPALIYADLLATGEGRCIETAQPMTNTLLNFSREHELQLIADVIAPVVEAASALHASAMITGDLARNLLIFYQYGIDTVRQTEDVDIAFSIKDWKPLMNFANT